MRTALAIAILTTGLLGTAAAQEQKPAGDEKENLRALRDRDPVKFRQNVKERLAILKRENPELFERIVERMARLRNRQKLFLLKHGDTDGDGKLSDAERTAMEAKREALLAGWEKEQAKENDWTDIADSLEDICGPKPPPAGIGDAYDELYDKDRFEAADTNHDGSLSADELKAARKSFEYYGDEKRFQHADADHNGILTLEECKAEKQWEKEHFLRVQREALEEIKKRNPNADLEDASWLKSHPDALAALLEHPYWVREHHLLVRELRLDPKWLAGHPAVAETVKRRWAILDRREDRADRREDIRDRKEDVRDAQHDGGPRDRLEDRRDHREDLRDRREDAWDAAHDWNDGFFKRRAAAAAAGAPKPPPPAARPRPAAPPRGRK